MGLTDYTAMNPNSYGSNPNKVDITNCGERVHGAWSVKRMCLLSGVGPHSTHLTEWEGYYFTWTGDIGKTVMDRVPMNEYRLEYFVHPDPDELTTGKDT